MVPVAREAVMLKCLCHALMSAVAIGSTALPASAQSNYPARTITIIVPFAAGGPTDVIARLVANHMTATLGQQMIIENVLGAGGTTGSIRAAQAAPTDTRSRWATWERMQHLSRCSRTSATSRTLTSSRLAWLQARPS